MLFFLQLAAATGDQTYLEDATQGADYVAANWTDVRDFKFVRTDKNFHLDFNHGLSGSAFSLAHAEWF